MKRRGLSVLPALFLVALLLLPTAWGAGKVCPLADTDLTLTLPDGCSVFTPSFKPDDPGLAYHGLTAAELSSYMEENALCVVAIDRESSDYLTVEVTSDTKTNTFSDYTNDQRQEFVSDIMGYFESQPDCEFLSWDYLHPRGAAPFYAFKYRHSTDPLIRETLTCYSILSGKAVVLTYCSAGVIMPEEEATVETIMASLSLRGGGSEAPGTGLIFFLPDLLLSAAAAFLPICVYRFAIRKATVPDRGKALKIVLIWSAVYVVLLLLFDDLLLFAPGVIPAGFLNYRILAGPKRKRLEEPPPSCDTPA